MCLRRSHWGRRKFCGPPVVNGVQIVRIEKGELFAIVVDEGQARSAGLKGVRKGRHLSITLKNDTFTVYMKREGYSFSAPAHGF